MSKELQVSSSYVVLVDNPIVVIKGPGLWPVRTWVLGGKNRPKFKTVVDS